MDNLKEKFDKRLKTTEWEMPREVGADIDTCFRAYINVANDLTLNVWFDLVDWTDPYIQATVYVPNLIGDWPWYNIIIELDVATERDKAEFIAEVIRLEERAIEILSFFKK